MLYVLKNTEQKIKSVATTKDAVEYMSCCLLLQGKKQGILKGTKKKKVPPP